MGHEQVCETIQANLKDVDFKKVGFFNIEVQSPENPKETIKFTINLTGLERKTPDELVIIIKEQVAKQMSTQGMDVTALDVKPSDISEVKFDVKQPKSNEVSKYTLDVAPSPSPKEVAVEMHKQIVSQ